ncbi:MAG: histidine phosphatase family protein, partial [Thiotrichales bacterium]|nr:histidine phosphatase family protein [Thiotrichales bacterium]
MTAHGFAQADSLVSTLTGIGIDHIRCSPYDRARQSVAPFASASGLDVRLDERLVERRRSRQPISNYIDFVRQSFADFDFCKPGGESGREVGARGLIVL